MTLGSHDYLIQILEGNTPQDTLLHYFSENVYPPHLLNFQNQQRESLGVCASERGYTQLVSLFIEQGLDVTLKNVTGESLLMWESYQGNTHHVKEILRQAPKEVWCTSKNSMNALGWASWIASSNPVKFKPTVQTLWFYMGLPESQLDSYLEILKVSSLQEQRNPEKIIKTLELKDRLMIDLSHKDTGKLSKI